MTVQKSTVQAHWLQAANLSDLELHIQTVYMGDHTLVLWCYDVWIYTLDNRCPHMGFPLDYGTCGDGI